MQQSTDLAYTTLTASYTAGGTTLTVASSSTGSGPKAFPSSFPFKVVVVDETTPGSPVFKSLLTVSAAPSGTTFTVSSLDGLDNNAVAGYKVYCVLTWAQILAILAEVTQVGTYSSLPNATSASRQGWLYKPTDAPQMFINDGSAWEGFINGVKVTDPTTLSWSWVPSQGSASVVSAKGMIYLTGTTKNNTDVRAYMVTVPSAPYTRTAMVFPQLPNVANCVCGIGVSDGTKFETFVIGQSGSILVTGVLQYATATSNPSAPTQVAFLTVSSPVMMRIVDDNVNRSYQISNDLGVNWRTAATVGRTSYLTPTLIGIYADPNFDNSAAPALTLASWS